MPKTDAISKKEFNEIIRRVSRLVNKWRSLLLLDHWAIKVVAINDRTDEESGNYRPQDVNGYWDVVMSTAADPYYMTASISVFVPVIKDFDDEQIEESLVHEFMHIYVSSMVKGKHLKEEEAVVTLLARTMIKLEHESNNKKPRPSVSASTAKG